MRVVVTGAAGFVGRHLRVALRAEGQHEVVPVDRATFADHSRLREALAGADTVVHLAGINRDRPDVLEEGNPALAQELVDAMGQLDEGPRLVIYANSAQAALDNPYGRGKRLAADILAGWADKAGGTLVDIRLCNVFGEWARPHYNTVVGTFCHQLVAGEQPTIIEDRTINLIHAQDVAARIMSELADSGPSREVVTAGRPMAVSAVLERLQYLRATYETGRLPDLSDPFDVDLFNTYRSYLYPAWYPRPLRSNRDQRGNFVELCQSAGGEAQTSFSTTVPGVTRGEHYHLRKIERFVVLAGEATMALRNVLDDEVTTYRVSGDEPVCVDMPTLCAHNITNVGTGTLYTAFWTNEIFDPDHPDTYREPVQ